MKTMAFAVGVQFVQRSGGDPLPPRVVQKLVVEALNELSNRGQFFEAVVLTPAEETELEFEPLGQFELIDTNNDDEPIHAVDVNEVARRIQEVEHPSAKVIGRIGMPSETPALNRLVARSGL